MEAVVISVLEAFDASVAAAVASGRLDRRAQAAPIAAARRVAALMDEPSWPIICEREDGAAASSTTSPASCSSTARRSVFAPTSPHPEAAAPGGPRRLRGELSLVAGAPPGVVSGLVGCEAPRTSTPPPRELTPRPPTASAIEFSERVKVFPSRTPGSGSSSSTLECLEDGLLRFRVVLLLGARQFPGNHGRAQAISGLGALRARREARAGDGAGTSTPRRRRGREPSRRRRVPQLARRGGARRARERQEGARLRAGTTQVAAAAGAAAQDERHRPQGRAARAPQLGGGARSPRRPTPARTRSSWACRTRGRLPGGAQAPEVPRAHGARRPGRLVCPWATRETGRRARSRIPGTLGILSGPPLPACSAGPARLGAGEPSLGHGNHGARARPGRRDRQGGGVPHGGPLPVGGDHPRGAVPGGRGRRAPTATARRRRTTTRLRHRRLGDCTHAAIAVAGTRRRPQARGGRGVPHRHDVGAHLARRARAVLRRDARGVAGARRAGPRPWRRSSAA